LPLHAVHWLLLSFGWAIGPANKKLVFLLACLLVCLFVLGCGCKGIYSVELLLVGSVRGGVFLLSCLVVRWLPACMYVVGFCCIVWVLLSAIVGGVCSLACFRSCSSSPSSSFLVPAGGSSSRLWFRFGSVSCSVAVRLGFLVVVFLLWFSNFYFGGSALWWWRRAWWCGGVFSSSFLCSFLRVEGGGRPQQAKRRCRRCLVLQACKV
jgi:hypothetical protein